MIVDQLGAGCNDVGRCAGSKGEERFFSIGAGEAVGVLPGTGIPDVDAAFAAGCEDYVVGVGGEGSNRGVLSLELL